MRSRRIALRAAVALLALIVGDLAANALLLARKLSVSRESRPAPA